LSRAILDTQCILHIVSGFSQKLYRYVLLLPVAILIAPQLTPSTEESLTILRGLGVQTSTISSTYLQTPTTRFIPTTSIQDVFIHEAFKGFEVRFYLMIVVEGEGDVVVVFPRLLPRRGTLEIVWRGVKGGLWEDSAKSAAMEKTVGGKAEETVEI
jgi:phosphatidylinositol glycan class H protein